MPKFGKGSKRDSNQGSLDCESAILLQSYHATQYLTSVDDNWGRI